MENSFVGYVKGGIKGCVNYLKMKDGKYQKPSAKDKRCNHCQYWALYYGNYKDFWCKHKKEHMKKLHPSVRISGN